MKKSVRWCRPPATVLLATALLAGCGSSPPETFHALTRYASDQAPASATTRGYGVLVGPVSLPDAVNRPQLVIRTGPGHFELREQQRWAGPLSADIAQALAEDLTLALPQAYVYSQLRSPAHALSPRFRVAVDVQRFESRLRGEGAGSVLDAAWVVTEVASGRKYACRSVARAPLQGRGYDALIVAHQTALAGVSEQVAAVVSQLAKGQAAFAVPAGAVCQR